MRVARLVGLSPDGRFVIVATEGGEELAVAADDRLRAALRGGPAASGKLEIEMESALSPREIQTRIRSGESVDDVARVASMDRDRVERFAAPVIAEREHVAGLAMTSSARRRGETSSHRTLRGVLNERLLNRGVDIDTVRWDSYRLDDGRWAVTADYRSDDTARQAVFYFDVPGRYSVAGNDEGRWVLGDTEDDTEPTLDLSDELALVRAIQDIPVASGSGSGSGSGSDTAYEVEVTEVELTIAEVVQLNRGAQPDQSEQTTPGQIEPESAEDDLDTDLAEVETELDRLEAEERAGSGLDALYEIFSDQDDTDEQGVAGQAAAEADEPGVAGQAAAEADEPVVDPEAAEATIEVLRSAGPAAAEAAAAAAAAEAAAAAAAAESSVPSDASAVPDLGLPLRAEAWEPAIVVDYPVEPGEDDSDVDGVEVPEGSDDPGRREAAVAREDRQAEAATLEPELVDAPPVDAGPVDAGPVDAGPVDAGRAESRPADEQSEPTDDSEPSQEQTGQPEPEVARSITEPEDQLLPLDVPEQPTPPPAPKPARRKRASVPSWDEIVFGGPKEK